MQITSLWTYVIFAYICMHFMCVYTCCIYFYECEDSLRVKMCQRVCTNITQVPMCARARVCVCVSVSVPVSVCLCICMSTGLSIFIYYLSQLNEESY